MLEVIGSEVFSALRYLFAAGIVIFIYQTAQSAGEKHGRLIALRNASVICFGLAAAFAITLGEASCAVSEGYNDCVEYNEDAYEPTFEEQIARFVFVATFLFGPASFGIMDSRRFQANPWKRPQ